MPRASGTVRERMLNALAGAASVDVAVFCLALMGTDYPAFLAEAHRVLKPSGRLWIAEVPLLYISSHLFLVHGCL